LFFDDDVDFPSDHEVMWVTYDDTHDAVAQVSTLFHGRVIQGAMDALVEASRHAMRPRIDVQWGKHGMMPFGWRTQTVDTLESDEDTEIPEGRSLTLLEYNTRITPEQRLPRALASLLQLSSQTRMA